MKKIAVLSTVALIGLGSLHATQAEARDGRNARAVAAGVVGGLVAGALIGAATSNAYAAPAYGYAYAPAYGYDYAPAPAYRTTRVVRRHSYVPAYEYEYAPRRTYRTTRVVRSYEYTQPRYGYGTAGYYGW